MIAEERTPVAARTILEDFRTRARVRHAQRVREASLLDSLDAASGAPDPDGVVDILVVLDRRDRSIIDDLYSIALSLRTRHRRRVSLLVYGEDEFSDQWRARLAETKARGHG